MNENYAHDLAVSAAEDICRLVAATEVDYDQLGELDGEIEAAQSRLDELTGEIESAEGYLPDDRMVDLKDDARAVQQELDALDAQRVALMDASNGCTSLEEARAALHSSPLSIEFRSGWGADPEALEAQQVRVVLCTGGPHVEIVADYSPDGTSHPRILYSSWGASGELFDFDPEVVTAYLDNLLGV